MKKNKRRQVRSRRIFSVKGVWGCCPIKQKSTPLLVWISCFLAPKDIACQKSQWLGHANLETTLIFVHADTEMKQKAIEKASQGICDVSVAKEDPNDLDDDTLKRLYGLR